MKLVSMKQAPKDKRVDDGCCAMEGERPDYPWGLRITLTDEQIEALGIKTLPAVGAPVAIEAVGTVQSVSDEAVDNGKSNRRIELQLTDLAMAGASPPMAERLYPSKKEA